MAVYDVVSAIPCDDVRKEINGKDIIIGAFTALNVRDMPAHIMFALWVEFKIKRVGDYIFDIKIDLPGGANSFSRTLNMSISDASNPIPIFLPPQHVVLTREGIMNISIKLHSENKWKVVRKINIKHDNTIQSFPVIVD